jgi:hypothetical protein
MKKILSGVTYLELLSGKDEKITLPDSIEPVYKTIMTGLSFPRKWESLTIFYIWISVFTEMTKNKYFLHRINPLDIPLRLFAIRQAPFRITFQPCATHSLSRA